MIQEVCITPVNENSSSVLALVLITYPSVSALRLLLTKMTFYLKRVRLHSTEINRTEITQTAFSDVLDNHDPALISRFL